MKVVKIFYGTKYALRGFFAGNFLINAIRHLVAFDRVGQYTQAARLLGGGKCVGRCDAAFQHFLKKLDPFNDKQTLFVAVFSLGKLCHTYDQGVGTGGDIRHNDLFFDYSFSG